mmetsp:Transcript_47660/g.102060  ORF Transcript_47660/g.102060 Transcript_47660/m.102060 type:complete len:246 (+) Transcript_47660:922-1659(+)
MSDLAVGRLMPDLKQELLVMSSLTRSDLHLEHMHHSHEQGHTIVPAPPFQLCLRRLQLVPEFLHALPARTVGTSETFSRPAPAIEVHVELPQPSLEFFWRSERPLGFSFFHLTAVEEVALNHSPLQPNPCMDVLQLSLAVFVRVFKLERVEVDCRQTLANDVDGVQVIHCHEARITLGGFYFNSVVDEFLAHDGERADITRIEFWCRSVGSDTNCRVHHALHLLFCDCTLANIMKMSYKRHLIEG